MALGPRHKTASGKTCTKALCNRLNSLAMGPTSCKNGKSSISLSPSKVPQITRFPSFCKWTTLPFSNSNISCVSLKSQCLATRLMLSSALLRWRLADQHAWPNLAHINPDALTFFHKLFAKMYAEVIDGVACETVVPNLREVTLRTISLRTLLVAHDVSLSIRRLRGANTHSVLVRLQMNDCVK